MLHVGQRMIVTTPGVTRLLDRLEEKRLVTRVRRREDHQKVMCRATRAALDLLGELERPITEVDWALVAKLERSEQREPEDLAWRIAAPRAMKQAAIL